MRKVVLLLLCVFLALPALAAVPDFQPDGVYQAAAVADVAPEQAVITDAVKTGTAHDPGDYCPAVKLAAKAEPQVARNQPDKVLKVPWLAADINSG